MNQPLYNKADVESWLNKAKDDLKWAGANLKDRFYSQTCFVAQQATEKALKAIIRGLQKDFTIDEIKELRTHKLIQLLNRIELKDIKIPNKIRQICEVLENYYLPTRYPDIPDPIEIYTKKLASDALEKAEEIVKFVEENLESRK